MNDLSVTLLGRMLRLAVVQNAYDQDLLSEEGAKELLAGPLTPGDADSVYDDSSLLNVPSALDKLKGKENDDE